MQLELLTPCAIPTCVIPVIELGDVCAGCQDLFGHMLQPRPQRQTAHPTGIPEANSPIRTVSTCDPSRKANQT
jgi:hypothetical protein